VDLGLFQNVAQNRRRSVWLILLSIVVTISLGGVIGAASSGSPWAGIGIAGVIATVLALFAWHQGSSFVLSSAGAKEIGKEDDSVLVNVVEEVAIAAGLPRPRIYLIDDPGMNAFATGISPDQACVAVTRGLRDALSRDELQGVMAHEMAHVGNYDTRVMILLSVLVGTVAIMSDMFLRGRMYRGRGRNQGAMMLVAILFAVLAPLASMMLQFAVSRKREYLADATAATMTRNPDALADALEKLGGRGKLEGANRGTQHLFIVNPFRTRQELSSAFATHPPLRERVRRLRSLAGRHAARSST
jgi:heat shock protein HtpX